MSHPDQAHYPRLEGDDLYVWARLINEAEHARTNLRKFGQSIARKYRLPEDRLLITDDGYLVIEEPRTGADGPGLLSEFAADSAREDDTLNLARTGANEY